MITACASPRLTTTRDDVINKGPSISFCDLLLQSEVEAAFGEPARPGIQLTDGGCYYGSARPRQDMPRIADWHARGLLDIDGLVTRRYPLADINRAYEDLDTDAVGRGVILF